MGVCTPKTPQTTPMGNSSFHSSKERFVSAQLSQVPIQSFDRVLRMQSRGLKLNVKAVEMQQNIYLMAERDQTRCQAC